VNYEIPTILSDVIAPDEYISMASAAKLMPGRPCAAAVWRRARKGVRIGGQVYRLRFIRSGRSMFTTGRWVQEHIEDCTRADTEMHRHESDLPADEAVTPKPMPRSQRNRYLAAERELDRLGF
jgi:hypothetical protein